MMNMKILRLRAALLIAKSEAEKVKDTDDNGTSNINTPTIYLPNWSESEIREAFMGTSLVPSIHRSTTFILRACEGQGYRRTAMAEAFCNSLRASGYTAGVDYRMD